MNLIKKDLDIEITYKKGTVMTKTLSYGIGKTYTQLRKIQIKAFLEIEVNKAYFEEYSVYTPEKYICGVK